MSVETVDVAVLLASYRGGGAERVMVSLANGLAEAGRKVDLVVCQPQGPVRRELAPAVREVSLGASRLRRAVWGLSRYLRRERPAAMLSTMAHVNMVAVAAGRLAGWRGRMVLREANHWGGVLEHAGNRKLRAQAALLRWAYRRGDLVIAGSEGVAADLVGRGVPEGRVRVIPNPVDVDAVRSAGAAPCDDPWFAGKGPPVVVAAGRLTRQKGFDVLLDAFALLRARRPARLIVLGEGPEHASLLRRAQELGIGRDVAFPGHVPSPFPWMVRCDLFVLSSRWEGLPNVLLQALACGCRVVSTDCRAGPDEILDRGRFGRLVPVNDATRLAEAMVDALDGCAPPRAELDEWLLRFAPERVLDDYSRALGIGQPGDGVMQRA